MCKPTQGLKNPISASRQKGRLCPPWGGVGVFKCAQIKKRLNQIKQHSMACAVLLVEGRHQATKPCLSKEHCAGMLCKGSIACLIVHMSSLLQKKACKELHPEKNDSLFFEARLSRKHL